MLLPQVRVHSPEGCMLLRDAHSWLRVPSHPWASGVPSLSMQECTLQECTLQCWESSGTEIQLHPSRMRLKLISPQWKAQQLVDIRGFIQCKVLWLGHWAELATKLCQFVSQEAVTASGLHQKQHGQQVKGGGPLPLFCNETSSGVLETSSKT